MLDSLVRVSRRVGTLHYLDLGHVKQQARYASAGEHRRRSTPTSHAAEPAVGSHRFLTPLQAVGRGIHAPQKARFPPAGCSDPD